jgi:hypothetical protein
MSKAAAARRRRVQAARQAPRRKKSAFAGLVVGGVLAAVIGGGIYAFSRPSPELQKADLNNIEAALSDVPAQDVPAPELGLPRPIESKRSYFHQSGKAMTIIYASHTDFDQVKTNLEASLAASGWKAIGGSGQPPAQAAQTWSGVFGREARVAQVSLVVAKGVTSVTYIVQDAT